MGRMSKTTRRQSGGVGSLVPVDASPKLRNGKLEQTDLPAGTCRSLWGGSHMHSLMAVLAAHQMGSQGPGAPRGTVSRTGSCEVFASGQGAGTWCSMRSVKRAHIETNWQHALPRPLDQADSGTECCSDCWTHSSVGTGRSLPRQAGQKHLCPSAKHAALSTLKHAKAGTCPICLSAGSTGPSPLKRVKTGKEEGDAWGCVSDEEMARRLHEQLNGPESPVASGRHIRTRKKPTFYQPAQVLAAAG